MTLIEVGGTYPGDLASVNEVRHLADEYRLAAHHLLGQGKQGGALSRAPCRLLAIHAIELYLNALLLHQGHRPEDVRKLQHRLSDRKELAVPAGLQLRKRTSAHLHFMTTNREYLVTRYATGTGATLSQINRLMATLNEVAVKVTAIVQRPCSLTTVASGQLQPPSKAFVAAVTSA